MATPVTTDTLDLAARFPGMAAADERPGYGGWIVPADKLTALATALRDDLGYDYLSSVTGVDYLAEGKMEVVYHVFKTTGGPGLCFKVQTPRENPDVPSLIEVYPGVELQEREAWDMYGIKFTDHPDLRRILTWEGFAGFPLRKDWKEAFYEEDVKPFKSRWPDGKAYRVEDKNPYGDNINFQGKFDPEKWVPDNEHALYGALARYQSDDGSGIPTDHILVNMGPQHPSTHGVFRVAAMLDGETIVSLKPVMGYLHRNHEKIGERNTFVQNMPYTDRLDYLSSMSNNFGYAITVEKLLGVTPPERAEYLRVIMAEFTRIANHCMALGALFNDMGAFFTPMLYFLEERELILDIFEAVSGSRMMCNYFRFGGVARDLPEGTLQKIKDMAFERLPRQIDEIDRFLTENEIVRSRGIGQGILTAEQAIRYSATGPVLRASNVPYDIRRAEPYSIYERFDFDIAVRPNGDIYDRYMVRIDEMRQSVRIIQQAVKKLPGGEILAGKPNYQPKVPAGEAYGRVEGPKGELGFYVISTGGPNPYRYHVRAPSFINLTCFEPMCIGLKIADVMAVLGSIDIVLGEVDR
jgi:NADH-quinone oxidoreductase subunit D/NADH-quinone oxidoreductase subunit C/D